MSRLADELMNSPELNHPVLNNGRQAESQVLKYALTTRDCCSRRPAVGFFLQHLIYLDLSLQLRGILYAGQEGI